MMSFLGTGLANVLVKIPFRDPTTTVPRRRHCGRRPAAPALRYDDPYRHLIALLFVVLVHL